MFIVPPVWERAFKLLRETSGASDYLSRLFPRLATPHFGLFFTGCIRRVTFGKSCSPGISFPSSRQATESFLGRHTRRSPLGEIRLTTGSCQFRTDVAEYYITRRYDRSSSTTIADSMTERRFLRPINFVALRPSFATDGPPSRAIGSSREYHSRGERRRAKLSGRGYRHNNVTLFSS